MKKRHIFFSALSLLAGIFLSGCVYVSLPGVEPRREKTIGGAGADKVLVIDISGMITGDDDKNMMGIETAPNITARIKEELNMAIEDSHVKAIVLRINTPGGTVTTCDIISHEITQFKKKKNIPVIAELMDVAASGGYYIAVSADKIIAHPTTVTGSIGVVAYNVNASGLMEKIGLVDQTIKSGDKKDMGSPLRPMTEDDKRILKTVIDGLYDRFLDVILEGRKFAGFTKPELKKIADGRIYSASQAIELKLIDSLGYLDDAVEAAKNAAGIKEARVITYSPASSYRNNVYSNMGGYAPVGGPPMVNLVYIDADSMTKRFGMRFVYLWMP
ncbi:MAG: signal peptide peptidase SppA [Deltaproteobacteria bacterium]|nr:signal peptide peptidase SppA [Deltaproteobacteria bacterium]